MRTLRVILLFVIALPLACQPDLDAWRVHLSRFGAARGVGLWTLALELDSTAGVASGRSVEGQLALTLNEERREVSGLGETPMLFGTYDVALQKLGVFPSTAIAVPAVIGVWRADSLMLRLAPGTEPAIELRGALQGDSILGRWRSAQLRGFDRMGVFVLRRR